jgi:hypothetical protein
MEARTRPPRDARTALVEEILFGAPAPLPEPVMAALTALALAREGQAEPIV